MLDLQQEEAALKKYLDILGKCPLFNEINIHEFSNMLSCLGARINSFKKNEIIFMEGEPAKNVGIVLSGSVCIEQTDYFGNRNVVAVIDSPQLFGESFACADVPTLPVNVIANEDCDVMLLDCRRITVTCNHSCDFHNRIIYNLLKIVASKNLIFHQKLQITSRRTTKEKLMAYLLLQAKEQGSNSFRISYDRQTLADYLGVERSAMSAEISKLRKEGVLESEKNHFKLL